MQNSVPSQLGREVCRTGVVLVTAFLTGSVYAGPDERGQICDPCLRQWNDCRLTLNFLAEALKNVLSRQIGDAANSKRPLLVIGKVQLRLRVPALYCSFSPAKVGKSFFVGIKVWRENKKVTMFYKINQGLVHISASDHMMVRQFNKGKSIPGKSGAIS